jgi:asparagine synthase (glutamine-hydrolysing)
MRDAMPTKVIDRTDKKGFATPEERWLRSDTTGMFRASLLATAHENPQVLSVSGVEAEFDLFLNRRKPYTNEFWRMITLGVWARRFGIQF